MQVLPCFGSFRGVKNLVLAFSILLTFPAAADCIGGKQPATIPIPNPAHQDVAYRSSRIAIFEREARQINPSIVFLGDSHIDGARVEAVSPKAIKLGIAGETWRGFLNFLPTAPFIRRAEVCVLLLGVNDTHAEAADFPNATYRMIDQFSEWATGKWVIVLVPQINERIFKYPTITNARIALINDHLKAKFSKRAGFDIVDPSQSLSVNGQLNPALSLDGLHLNGDGYKLLMPQITRALGNLGAGL